MLTFRHRNAIGASGFTWRQLWMHDDVTDEERFVASFASDTICKHVTSSLMETYQMRENLWNELGRVADKRAP